MNKHNQLLRQLKDVGILNANLSQHGRSAANLLKHQELYKNVCDATSFIQYDIDIKGRIVVLQMGLTFQPLCEICNQIVKIRTTGKLAKTYPKFCANGCSNKSEGVKNKKKDTSIRTYGVENVSQASVIKNKKRQTNLRSRGVEFSLSDPSIRQKIKQTCFERFGGPSPNHSPGVEHKRRTTCISRYGTPYAAQALISPEALDKLNNKHWLNDQYFVDCFPLWKIGDNLNVCARTVTNYFIKHGLTPKIEHSTSLGERELCRWIKEELGFGVLSNTRKIIAPKELDVFIPERKVAIEYNGVFFHSTDYVDKEHHYHKSTLCEEQNIDLIHIFDVEWNNKRPVVEGWIGKKLNTVTVFDHMDYNVFVVDDTTASEFYAQHNVDTYFGISDINLCVTNPENKIIFMCSYSCVTNTIENYAETPNERHKNVCKAISGYLKAELAVNNFYVLHQKRLGRDIMWSEGMARASTHIRQIYPDVRDCGHVVIYCS